ncbi:MAG: acetyltransferase [Lachnospiraceae bacterium]|nr:acetyltransferase [Lachnospiraceae bacterium]
MEQIILIGAGGHAKTVIDTLERQNQYEIVGLVDREYNKKFCYRGYGIIGLDKDLEKIHESGVRNAVITIGDIAIRSRLYKMAINAGFQMPVIVDNTAVLATDVQIGDGTYVGRNVVVNADVTIGENCIINTSSVVEHDCKIGNSAHIAVGATLCGGVAVGSECLVGANATIIPNIQIGANSVIGAGAIVTKSVDSGVVMINKVTKFLWKKI